MRHLLQYIEESKGNINRLLGKHTRDGYIIISACRSTNAKQKNEADTAELEKIIKATGWSYSPCEGKYVEKIEVNGEKVDVPVSEKSFVVYGNGADTFADLKKFAIKICNKYNQDSVLVVAPGGKPVYYDKKGDVDTQFSSVEINREDRRYKTRLGNSTFSFNESQFSDEQFTYFEDDLREAIGYLAYKIRPNFFEQLKNGKWAVFIMPLAIRVNWEEGTWQYRARMTSQLHDRIAEVMKNYELVEIDPVLKQANGRPW